jgi:hypothetical protein
MFYIPMVVGALTAGAWSWALLLFFISATGIFFSREPLLAFWRAWRRGLDTGRSKWLLALYAGIGAIAGLALAVGFGLYDLIPIGFAGAAALVVNAEMSIRAQARSLLGESLAIAASVFTAPAAYYVVKREWTAEAAVVWLLCLAYFLSSVFYVKLRVSTAHAKLRDQRPRAARICAVYHVVLLGAMLASGLWYLAAFAAVIARAFYFLLRPTTELNLKRIGWTEVVYSLIFTFVAPIAIS